MGAIITAVQAILGATGDLLVNLTGPTSGLPELNSTTGGLLSVVQTCIIALAGPLEDILLSVNGLLGGVGDILVTLF